MLKRPASLKQSAAVTAGVESREQQRRRSQRVTSGRDVEPVVQAQSRGCGSEPKRHSQRSASDRDVESDVQAPSRGCKREQAATRKRSSVKAEIDPTAATAQVVKDAQVDDDEWKVFVKVYSVT